MLVYYKRNNFTYEKRQKKINIIEKCVTNREQIAAAQKDNEPFIIGDPAQPFSNKGTV